jgi:hypothetical protein
MSHAATLPVVPKRSSPSFWCVFLFRFLFALRRTQFFPNAKLDYFRPKRVRSVKEGNGINSEGTERLYAGCRTCTRKDREGYCVSRNLEAHPAESRVDGPGWPLTWEAEPLTRTVSCQQAGRPFYPKKRSGMIPAASFLDAGGPGWAGLSGPMRLARSKWNVGRIYPSQRPGSREKGVIDKAPATSCSELAHSRRLAPALRLAAPCGVNNPRIQSA